MNKNLYLDRLKSKPKPNEKMAEGITVAFAKEFDEKKDETINMFSEEVDVEDALPKAQIVDVSKQRNLDRNKILRRLRGRDILTVQLETLPAQSPIEERVLEDKMEQQFQDIGLSLQPPIEKKVDKEPIKLIKKPTEIKIKRPAKKEETEKEETKKEEPTIVNEKEEQIDDIEEPAPETKNEVEVRLPKKGEKQIIRASTYYMNNRQLFVQHINKLFSGYRKELEDANKEVSCSSQSTNKNFELLTHQKVVRDYLNLYTPYRGLLLYHNLGTGKTCSAIAIAEGMKTQRKVFVMTPASLKMNFFSELKKCGDDLYKKNQYWEFVSVEGQPEFVRTLSKSLSLPVEYIESKKGAWLVDINKPANFTELDSSDQINIDKQLNVMIREKYTDIHYNAPNVGKILNKLSEDGSKNPFDNSVILIDEAHNLVSRIVNKVKSPESPSYRLYDYVMSAQNARVVLISGTPIINYPNEIAIMFNLIRGYIKTWTFSLTIKTKEKVNRELVLKLFDEANFRTYDYVEYTGNKLIITRNPFGFINAKKPGPTKTGRNKTTIGGTKMKKTTHRKKRSINKTKKSITSLLSDKDLEEEIVNERGETETEEYDRLRNVGENEPHYGGAGSFDKYGGVKVNESGNISDEDFEKTVIRILTNLKTGITDKINKSDIHIDLYKSLPDEADVFNSKFIDVVSKTFKNKDLFQRRILGLSSYYRSAQEQLMPRYVKTEDYDFDIDVKGTVDKHVNKRLLKSENALSYPFNIGDEIEYNRPGTSKWTKGKIAKVNEVDGSIYHVVRCEMSSYQFSLYEKIRKDENDRETTAQKKKRQQAQKGDELYTVTSTYRIFSRAACNFVFPEKLERPLPDKSDIGENEYDAVLDEKKINKTDEDDDEDDDVPKTPEEKSAVVKYQDRIRSALENLERGASQYLTPESLSRYSPKFNAILNNLKDEQYRGLHLLYTQFRTLEGVGILKLILEANGFVEFKIQRSKTVVDQDKLEKNEEKDISPEEAEENDELKAANPNISANDWVIVTPEGSEGKPRFVLYTGTETAEEKEILRNIYNSAWEYVPTSIADELRKISANNFYGEVIKLMMITASGAEGINLKNTRYVHIVEPYWHLVRIEQVVGRARRICSHEDLPLEDRNIQVFLYLSTIGQEEKENGKHIDLIRRDTSKLDKNVPFTTDETLFEMANIKDGINQQILTAIKESAMDCSLYNAANKNKDTTKDTGEKLVCYGFGQVSSNDFSSYPSLERDAGEKFEVEGSNVQTIKGLIEIIDDGMKYVYNKKTSIVYDYASYLRASEDKNQALIRIGILVKNGDDYNIERDS